MKILILSCGTGGGHNSAALAIQESLVEKGIQADFVEYLDIINKRIKDSINHLYIKTTHKNGRVFKQVYRLGELYQKTKLKSPVYGLNLLNKNRLYQYILENNYDYIITTHLFAAQALTAIKKDHSIHFIAVATDYVCIPFWEETNPDYFIIPSEELVDDFVRRGIAKEKLLPLGIPVKKVYLRQNQDKVSHDNVSLKDKINVLILTGSMGFGNITEMLRELLEKLPNIRFIVACGNNIELLKALKCTYQGNENVVPLSFTNEIDKYMKQSKIILTKPGGLTTTEVATLGKPFIHTMPIPGCENYNADFFSQRKMALQCHSIAEVVANTKKLLEDERLQLEMIENQNKYMKQDTCDKITELILNELK